MSQSRTFMLRENKASKLREEIIRTKIKNQTLLGIPSRLPPLTNNNINHFNKDINSVSKRKIPFNRRYHNGYLRKSEMFPHLQNGSLKAASDESIERLNSDDNLSNRTFVLDGDSTDDEELNPVDFKEKSFLLERNETKRPSSKIPIKINSNINVPSLIAKKESKASSVQLPKNNAIQSANSESTKSIVISGIKEIDAVTINSHGFGILGHTPGYKTTILQEYLSSLPDLIFIQDSIYIEDMKEILDSICPNTYDHQFSNDPSEINKIDDKDEDKSITGVIWKTDKYSKSSLLLGSSSPTHPFNSKLSIVKLDSKVEKKSQDSLGNDMYPSMICASWHGPDYSTPLRSRVHTLKEVLKYLNKLRPLNSWFPILLGGDFNMDIMKNSEDLNKEFFFVSYRPTSGTMLKDLKTTFAFNWDYLLATETRVKQYHPDIFSNPFVFVRVSSRVLPLSYNLFIFIVKRLLNDL
nr:uncharacterized protein LOC121116620 [Lepeophtheirus salmonis]